MDSMWARALPLALDKTMAAIPSPSTSTEVRRAEISRTMGVGRGVAGGGRRWCRMRSRRMPLTRSSTTPFAMATRGGASAADAAQERPTGSTTPTSPQPSHAASGTGAGRRTHRGCSMRRASPISSTTSRCVNSSTTRSSAPSPSETGARKKTKKAMMVREMLEMFCSRSLLPLQWRHQRGRRITLMSTSRRRTKVRPLLLPRTTTTTTALTSLSRTLM
mmetsp:Transcript_33348/g.71976  ORF Transcript_33348/g.71976 Transcript_33348/m.71976 type:complete len:219 (+) Transcript_33348:863-1519(+)